MYLRLRRFLILAVLLSASSFMLSNVAFAVCDPATNPVSDFCDEILHPENYSGGDSGTLCVDEPAPPDTGTPPEILGTSVCVSGIATQVANLASFFVEVNSVSAPVDVPPRVVIDPNTLTDGSFEVNVSLPSSDPGLYVALTNALYIGGMGLPTVVPINRQFIKVAAPDLKITLAVLNQADEDLTPGITQDVGTGEYTLSSDPIASKTLDICLANAEGDASGSKVIVTVTNEISEIVEAGEEASAKRWSYSRPCPTVEDIDNAEAEAATVCCTANEVAEEDCTEEKLEELGCPDVEVFCGRNALCAAGNVNGFLITGIPLGNGTNDLSIQVQNTVTGYGPGDGQIIEVAPMENQLEAPELCLQFFDQSGNYIEKLDGWPVRADEVTNMVLVAGVGECPEAAPTFIPSVQAGCDLDALRLCNDYDKDGLLDVDDPDNNSDTDTDKICDLPAVEGEEGAQITCQSVCDNLGVEDCEEFLNQINISPCPTPTSVLCTTSLEGDPVVMNRACIQEDNETLPIFERGNPDKQLEEYYEMCPSAGDDKKYVFKLIDGGLKFPLKAVTVKAVDEGRDAQKSVSFGYGELRSRFDDEGNLITTEVDAALAGHIPKAYLEVTDSSQGALIDDVEFAMNTDKFKQDIFLALFKPQAPSQEAVEQCDWVGPQPNLFRTFNIVEPTIGALDITSLRFLNKNRAWVRLEIAGLSGFTEIFTIKCNESDCAGLDLVDNKLQGACFEKDQDLGLGILPVELQINWLTVNIEIQLSKDENGLTVTSVGPIPGHDLIDAWGPGGRLVKFRCDRPWSRTRDGDGCYDASTETDEVWIDQPGCRAMESLNEQINGSSLEPTPTSANVSTQLVETIKSQVSCLTPKILTEELAEFSEKPLLPFTVALFGKEFTTEIFSDLLKADLILSPRGVSFKGTSLVLPSGAFEEGDPTPDSERDSIQFMNNLPADQRNSDFGYLADKESGLADPIGAARRLRKNINLTVKEELVNMALHGVSTMLIELLDREPDFVDTNDFGIVDRFGIGATVAPQQCFRIDDEGLLAFVEVENQSKECFPLRLQVDQIIGEFDLNGDGSVTQAELSTPLRFRLKLNPKLPPMVQLLSSSTIEDVNGRPQAISLALKIALSDTELQVFEDSVLTDENGKPVDPETNLRRQVEGGETVSVVSWCDHQPQAHPNCTGDQDVPILTFRLDASLTAWAQYETDTSDGKLKITAGLKPKELHKPNGEVALVPDPEASFFKVSVKENNTPFAAAGLAINMNANLNGTTLNLFNFGAGNEFALEIDTEFPVDAVCDGTAEADSFDEILQDFGFRSLGLDDPVVRITSGDPRYLGVGFDPVLNRCDGSSDGSLPSGMEVMPPEDDPSGLPEEPDPDEDPEEPAPGADGSDGADEAPDPDAADAEEPVSTDEFIDEASMDEKRAPNIYQSWRFN